MKNKNARSEIVQNEECMQIDQCTNLPQVFEEIKESACIARSWKSASSQRKQFNCYRITNQLTKSWKEVPRRLGMMIRKLEIRKMNMKTRNSWMEIPRKIELITEAVWVRIMIHGPQSRLLMGRLVDEMQSIRILKEKFNNSRNLNLMNEKVAWFMNQSRLSNIEKFMICDENDDGVVGKVTNNQLNEEINGTIMRNLSKLELRAIFIEEANCRVKSTGNRECVMIRGRIETYE